MDNKIYYDNAATTQPLPQVIDVMKRVMEDNWYNSSAVYLSSYSTKSIINKARENVAALVKCGSENIVFTSGATEANNMVLSSVIKQNAAGNRIHIISSKIEHPSVYETLNNFDKGNVDISYVPVTENGVIDIYELERCIKPNTVLISIMYANNETGVIQPIKKVVEIAKEHKIKVHTDAVQAVGHIDIDVSDLGVDYLTASAHKMNGPKGVGFVYIKDKSGISPLIMGGGQENGLRSGTENTEGIVGFGEAAAYCLDNIDDEYTRIAKIRDYIEERLVSELDDISINGKKAIRIPGITNIRIGGIEAEALIMLLDMKGICISGGSACSAHDRKPSRVLQSMGLSDFECKGSIRISLGRNNTLEEAEYATNLMIETIKEARRAQL